MMVRRGHFILVPMVLGLLSCRAGGDLKNEDHYLEAERTEIAAEAGGAGSTNGQTAVAASPSPSASPSVVLLTGTAAVSTGIAAGSCAGPLFASLVDASRAAVTAESTYLLNLSDSLGGGFYSSSTCASAISQLSIYKGASSASFYYKNTLNGSAQLQASADGLATGTLSLSIAAAAVASISLGIGNTSPVAGVCTALRYEFRDTYGNVAAIASADSVQLRSSDAVSVFSSVSDCSTTRTSVSEAAGATGRSDLYYRGGSKGAFTLTASMSGSVSGTVAGNLAAGSASLLSWIGSDGLTAGSCAAYTVQTTDAYGNASAVDTGISATVSASQGGLYGDSACASSRSTVSIAAGQSSARAYFRSNVAGSVTLAASGSGFTSGSLAVPVAASTASGFALNHGDPLAAGSCHAFTLSTVDAYANTSSETSSRTVTLAGGGSNSSFYSNSSCVTPASTASVTAGQPSTAFYYKTQTAQTASITLSSGTLESLGRAVTVVGATAATLAVGGPSAPVRNKCNTYTLSVYDAYGNPFYNPSGTAVTVNALGVGAFYQDSGCASGVSQMTIPALTHAVAAYYLSSQYGSVTLRGGTTSISYGSAVAALTYSTASGLTISGGDAFVHAGYCSESAYTATVNDAYGNAVPSGSTQTLTFTGLGAVEPYLGWTCIGPVQQTLSIPSGQSQTAFYLSGTRPGASSFTLVGASLAVATKSITLKTRYQVSGGIWASCHLLASGRVKCLGDPTWGTHLNAGACAGSCYYGDNPDDMGVNLAPALLGTNRTALRLTAAEENLSNIGLCAILDNHQMRCWGHFDVSNGLGNNASGGTLGSSSGDNLAYTNLGTNRTVYRVSGGYSGYCAVLDNGGIKCWGGVDGTNLVTQNGYGDTVPRGQTAGTIADNLPYTNIGTGVVAADVSCSRAFCCALTTDHRAKCWGYGNYGRLAYGDALYRGDGPGQMGDCLPYVDVGTGRTVRYMATTTATNCFVLDTGKVRCFGYGTWGALLSGATSDQGDVATEVGDQAPYLNFGINRTLVHLAPRGAPNNAANAGYCALLDNAKVKCWGSPGYQGYGDNIFRGTSAGTIGENLPYVNLGTNRTVVLISAGSYANACAILDTGEIKCWGEGTRGKGGWGDTLDRGFTSGTMGDCLPPVDFGEAAY